jgi:exosortase
VQLLRTQRFAPVHDVAARFSLTSTASHIMDANTRPEPLAASLLRDGHAVLVTGITTLAFAVVFAAPLVNTVRTWWTDPESGHGLLLAPLAIVLAWRQGVSPDRRPQPWPGTALLLLAVGLRWVAALAAEAFVGRASMLLAVAALVVYFLGARQLLRWWLPVALLCLSVPLPEIVLGALALPLQFQASRLGAALLETRGVAVLLDGNVIRLPGHDLFVTEACSGLRSLTALLSLGVLLGGMLLRHPVSRVALLAVTIPVAVVINGVRVFLTGFLVLFVNPSLAEGFTHLTEGWLMFVIAFVILAGVAWLGTRIERRALAAPHAA